MCFRNKQFNKQIVINKQLKNLKCKGCLGVDLHFIVKNKKAMYNINFRDQTFVEHILHKCDKSNKSALFPQAKADYSHFPLARERPEVVVYLTHKLTSD